MTSDLKRTTERFHNELILDWNLEAADSLLAPGFRLHSNDYLEELLEGPDGARMLAGSIRTAFPDIQISHDDVIAEGNKVIDRWTCTGTHRGEFNGIPPTNRPVTLTGIDILRVEEGRIAEMWQNIDAVGMLRQMGVAQ